MPRIKGSAKTPGSGRKKGTPNMATADIKALAGEQGPAAIKKLTALMDSADERTAMAAANSLLDRGYGKPAQSMAIAEHPKTPAEMTEEELIAIIRAEHGDEVADEALEGLNGTADEEEPA